MRQLPDEPRFLEARAMLRNGAGCRGADGNYLIWQSGTGLVALVGRPAPAVIRDTLAGNPEMVTMLADSGQSAAAAAAIPHWERSTAQRLVHVENRSRRNKMPLCIRFLSRADANGLRNLPDDIRAAVRVAAIDGAAAAVWAGGHPVSVCYTGWQTESLCDVAVFTQPEHRGKGYATAAAAHVLSHIRATGRLACWFADESNTASLSIARKLGFRRSDQAIVFRRPLDLGENQKWIRIEVTIGTTSPHPTLEQPSSLQTEPRF
jgi:GNAT superfamily N-acetyltransferase